MPYKNARDSVKIAAKCRVFVGSPLPSLGGSGGSSWLGLGESFWKVTWQEEVSRDQNLTGMLTSEHFNHFILVTKALGSAPLIP